MTTKKPKTGLEGIASRRTTAVRVKKTRRMSNSSHAWLERQLNDPYVTAARAAGYRSRAAFKLLQMDEKFHFFRLGQRVVDLGAAPGGWSQIAVTKIGKKGKLVGLDLLPIDPLAGADLIQMDFMDDDAPARLSTMLGGKADIVLSDMAPSTTGHTGTDHIRIMGLADLAAAFACEILAKDGCFVCKLFQGGAEKGLLDYLNQNFAKVRHAKPPASRQDSSETYIVAMGFKARTEET